jgi:hypothetical protein
MHGYEDRLARRLRLGEPFIIKGLIADCEMLVASSPPLVDGAFDAYIVPELYEVSSTRLGFVHRLEKRPKNSFTVSPSLCRLSPPKRVIPPYALWVPICPFD